MDNIVFRGNFIVLNLYIRKEIFKINYEIFHPKKLERD